MVRFPSLWPMWLLTAPPESAKKAMPGFDVIDYGQEDYVFGDEERDARHWDSVLLDIFETYADVLAPLFNNSSNS